jgi:integrase
MGEIFDKYQREILPTYQDKTQKNKARHLELLAAGFGDLKPGEIRPHHIYSFRDRIARKYPTQANRTQETLSHVFTKAIEWGVAEYNPCRDVRSLVLQQRERYVTDYEFRAVHQYCSPMLQCAMELAVLTGLRRGDLLGLKRDNLSDEGILVRPSKTRNSSGKVLLIEWSDELRAVVKRALSIPPQVRRHLIANRQGKAYTGDGFRNVWETARAKALREGELLESYRFSDLRVKSASDDDDAERASQRLGHTSRSTTERFYRRKPAKVRPLR